MNNIVTKKRNKEIEISGKKVKKKPCVQYTWYTENLEEFKYKYRV